MPDFICLDSSVLIKVLVPEDLSPLASELMRRIIVNQQLIILPPFAWAEIGSILRKKIIRKEIKALEAASLWHEYTRFPGIRYMDNELILERSWIISRALALPTLYDSAFLAVSEIIAEHTGLPCEFWTADEKLVRFTKNTKHYVRFLKDFVARA